MTVESVPPFLVILFQVIVHLYWLLFIPGLISWGSRKRCVLVCCVTLSLLNFSGPARQPFATFSILRLWFLFSLFLLLQVKQRTRTSPRGFPSGVGLEMPSSLVSFLVLMSLYSAYIECQICLTHPSLFHRKKSEVKSKGVAGFLAFSTELVDRTRLMF